MKTIREGVAARALTMPTPKIPERIVPQVHTKTPVAPPPITARYLCKKFPDMHRYGADYWLMRTLENQGSAGNVFSSRRFISSTSKLASFK